MPSFFSCLTLLGLTLTGLWASKILEFARKGDAIWYRETKGFISA